MSHPYALLLIHTYFPILHPSAQGATEENLDLEGGPPEALALRGSLVHPNKWGRFTKVKLTECSPSPHQNRQRLEVWESFRRASVFPDPARVPVTALSWDPGSRALYSLWCLDSTSSFSPKWPWGSSFILGWASVSPPPLLPCGCVYKCIHP